MVYNSSSARLVYLDSSLSMEKKNEIAHVLFSQESIRQFSISTNREECEFVFEDNLGLQLSDKLGKKLHFDFDLNHIDYNRKGHRGKQELIAKALGANKGIKHILDLSSGLGQDAVFLSQIGLKVLSIERNPFLFLLLSDARARTKRAELSSLEFKMFDSREFLTTQNLDRFQAIYFDPMYPHKKKTALPRQEMLFFRDIVGDDDDAQVVALAARKVLAGDLKRLVIKRPLSAEPLLEGSIHSYEGKTVRYDLYS